MGTSSSKKKGKGVDSRNKSPPLVLNEKEQTQTQNQEKVKGNKPEKISTVLNDQKLVQGDDSPYLAFFSHRQQECGDRVAGLVFELEQYGHECWFDMRQSNLTLETMQQGVRDAKVFVLFASPTYADSWFCRMELIEALRMNKPIVVVDNFTTTEESSGSSRNLMDVANQFLHNLYKKLPSDLPQSINEKTFVEICSATRVDFCLFRGNPKRISVLRTIINKAGLPFVYDSTKTEVNAEILLVGHSETGMNQCELISQALNEFGVFTQCLYESDDIDERANCFRSNVFQTLLVFVTDETLLQTHVSKVIRIVDSLQKKIVLVYEDDPRRPGVCTVEGIKKQTKPEPWLMKLFDMDWITFSRDSRRQKMLNVKVKEIAERCGFPDLIELSPDFTPYARALEKGNKLEPGTRQWLIDELLARATKEENCFFLLADAGMGKSTVMGSIAKRASSMLTQLTGSVNDLSIHVIALHFFIYTSRESRSIAVGLRSIARQLCRTIPGFRNQLAKDKAELEEKLKGCDKINPNLEIIKKMIQELIIQPCQALQDPPKQRQIILLDALDECENPQGFAQAIQECWKGAPAWLVLVGSSRPNYFVKQHLSDFETFCFTLTDKPDDPNRQSNEKDIIRYVENRMQQTWGKSDTTSIQQIGEAVVLQSEGLFLWLEFQEQELSEKAKTDGGLTVKDVRSLPKGILGVYNEFFGRIYTELGEDVERYQRIFALGIVLPRQPIPETIWKGAMKFGKQYDKFKNKASSLLIFGEDNLIRAPHKSMVDFLLDVERTPKQQGEFNLAVELDPSFHEDLAVELETQYQSITLKDWERNNESNGEKHLTTEQQFACLHTAHHWTQAGKKENAGMWFYEFQRLFRMICQAVDTSSYQQMIDDCKALLKGLEKIEEKYSLLKYILDILVLAKRSLTHDPREFAGQCLGRSGIEPFDREQQFIVNEAQKWLKRAREEGKLKILSPACFGWSGLQPAGGSLLQLIPHDSVVSSIAVGLDGKIFTASGNNGYIYDENGQLLKTLEGHSHKILSIAVSSDGEKVFTGSSDSTARVWDVESGILIKTLEGHSSHVNAIAVSSDGRKVFTGSLDNTARIWDVESGKVLKTLDEHTSYVNAIAVSSDGKKVFTGSSDNTARIWDVESGKLIKTLEGHSDRVWSIAVSSDGKKVFTGSSDNTARIWDVESGILVKTLEGHSSHVNAIVVSSDGRKVFTGSWDQTARIWDVESGKLIKTLEGHSSVVLRINVSSDGRVLATSDGAYKTIYWDIESGKELKKFNKNDWSSSIECEAYQESKFIYGSNECDVGYTQDLGVRVNIQENLVFACQGSAFECWRLS